MVDSASVSSPPREISSLKPYQTGTFKIDGNSATWQDLRSNGGDRNQVTTSFSALAYYSAPNGSTYYYFDNSGILEVLLSNGGGYQYIRKN